MPLNNRPRLLGEFKDQGEVLLASIGERCRDGLLDFMAAEDLKHGAPDMGFGCREEGLEGLVDKGYSFVTAGDHYALFHARENASQT